MAAFDFDESIDRRDSASLKWERYHGRDILPLWVADMDFKSPPAVIRALQERVAHGVFGYTLPSGALIEALQERLYADFQWSIEAEWIVWLPGLVTGLNVACRAVGAERDDVLTGIPVYPPFLSAPAHARRNLVTVALSYANDRWAYDADLLEKAVTERTRLFILCNPHNPVGRVFDQDELLKMAAICARHDIVICSDEIHCDLVLDTDKRHLPIATLGDAIADRTITLMAPSKTYNLPGLGCAYAIISNPGLRRRFKRCMTGIVPNVNLMGFSAALAALRDDGQWLKALIQYLRRNRARLTAAIEALPGLRMGPIEATYLGWIDTRSTDIERPAEFFEQAGVGLSDGADFGGPGFVRLNFGCTQKVLSQALQRMGDALAKR